MPFPLAHPAAVMPLRRYCSRYLSFPALIVGSICPDAGYCLDRLNASEFSHQFLGSFGFCLPVGVFILMVLYGAILPAIEKLPKHYQRAIPPLALWPLGSPFAVIVSLLIGSWTHLLWDSFTHTGGWSVEHVPLLQTALFSVGRHTFRVCHLLWYLSSFVGMLLLFIAYDHWRQTSSSVSSTIPVRANWRNAVLVSVMVLPIEFIHHLVHGTGGRYLVAALTAALGIGIALKTKPMGRINGGEAPQTEGARQCL
jgi:hypothetical protein